MAGDNGFLSVSLAISGVEVEQKFATWGTAISDLSPAFEQIGEDLQADFALNMASEGGLFSHGAGWEPLAESTIQDRIRQGYDVGPILWRTGALGHSLAERDAEGNVFDVGPEQLTVGSELFYAGFHQLGTSRMPARPIVGVTWSRRSLIIRRIGDFVRAQAAQAGLSMSGDGSGGGEE